MTQRTGSPSQTQSSSQSVPPVVTIYEYYGARGEEIGQVVAERLGVRFHAQAFSSEQLSDPRTDNDELAELVRVLTVMGGAYGGVDSRDVATVQRERYELIVSNTKTVWDEADTGGVIMGRNGAAILRDRPNTLHVLLTGAVQDRIAHASQRDGVSLKDAAERQRREDQVRADMSLTFYGWDPRLPDAYDLVINTSRIPVAFATASIIDALGAAGPS